MISPSALIIAGSDSGAGAGMQADLKTFTAYKIYAATVITAITAQNTLGVDEVFNIPLSSIEAQLKSVSKDLKISLIKIGMLSNKNIIDLISNCLEKYFPNIPVILDPVMVAKGGHLLLSTDAIETLKKKLFPKSYLITPNLPEAEKIINTEITNSKDMEKHIQEFYKMNVKNVLLKGGHLNSKKIIDILQTDSEVYKFISSKIESRNTHGTGCTLASAIACNLFKGFNLYDSVKNARAFILTYFDPSVFVLILLISKSLLSMSLLSRISSPITNIPTLSYFLP